MNALTRKRLEISDHAVERYLQRWGSTSTSPLEDLERLVNEASPAGTRVDPHTLCEDVVYVHESKPDVELIVRDDRFEVNARVLVTILPRATTNAPRSNQLVSRGSGRRRTGRAARW